MVAYGSRNVQLLKAVSTASWPWVLVFYLLLSRCSPEMLYCHGWCSSHPRLILFLNSLSHTQRYSLQAILNPQQLHNWDNITENFIGLWSIMCMKDYAVSCKDYEIIKGIVPTQTQLDLYFYKDLFLFTVYACLTCMYVMCTTPIPGAWGDPKKTLALLELELWMIVNHALSVRAENWTLSLCKSHQCSIQLSHLSVCNL